MPITVEEHFEIQKQVKVDGVVVAYVNTVTGGICFLPKANYRRARIKPKFTEQEVIDEVRRHLNGIAG